MAKQKQFFTKLAKITSKISAQEFQTKIGCDIHTFLTDDLYKVPNVKRYTAQRISNQFQITVNQQGKKTIGFEAYSEEIKFPVGLAGKEKIVIILESPHDKEYEESKPFHALTPANGITGRQIEGHLFLILQKLDELKVLTKDEYEICIINPVPFQTSLGSFIKSQSNLKLSKDEKNSLKKEIWKHLWQRQKVQAEFEELLKTIPDDSIVINSCTNTSLQQQTPQKTYTDYASAYNNFTHEPDNHDMKQHVEDAIIQTLQKKQLSYCVTRHPSSTRGKYTYTASINNMNILDLSK